MYYVLNETDQIIAADDTLLTLCNVTDISGLSSKISAGETSFTFPNEEYVSINMNTSQQTYSVSKTPLSSTLGHLTLVEIGEAQEPATDITDNLLLDTDDEATHFDIAIDENENDLFEVNETIKEENTPDETNVTEQEDELFDLLSDPGEGIDIDKMNGTDEQDTGEIVVDVATTSQIMGISDEDYTLFLNEYIDTALALEEDLQSDNMDIRNTAIMTLTDLSEIMHLPEISNIIQNIHASTPAQQKGYIGSLYTTLSRLTTKNSATDSIELFDTIEEETATDEPIVEKAVNPNGFGTIDLSDVKPKHFDFQLEEAANDLSLPVDLIEEFVHDFIEQAHIETKKMLEAYEEGDLAKVQAIAHLLKGASSNLRIKDLSDTLYKIQFCENENGLDDLIKDYWAHFLSFEHQIDVISN